jgi:hypothetical protein
MIVRPLQVLEPKPVGTIRPFTMRKHSGAHRGGECRWHTGHCAKPPSGITKAPFGSFRFFMEQSELEYQWLSIAVSKPLIYFHKKYM